MHEDKGVEMDPHAHESQYIYPDVVKLMDSVGLPESKVIGGTIYNDSNGVNIWTNLVNGQYGLIFPNKFWKPNYMMGGGTPNHLNDLKYYGLWNPQSPTNYLINDTTLHLTHLGVGCSFKISDTTNVNDFVAGLHALVQAVQTGQYPTNGFYIQTIFFEQGDLNTLSFYNKVIEIADSAQAIVASGAASWKTFKEAYTIWENNYNKQAFQWQCGQVATDVTSITQNLPQLKISWCSNSLLMIQHLSIQDDLQVIDVSGRVWKKIKSPSEQLYIDVSSLASGLYFIKNGTTTQTFVKN